MTTSVNEDEQAHPVLEPQLAQPAHDPIEFAKARELSAEKYILMYGIGYA